MMSSHGLGRSKSYKGYFALVDEQHTPDMKHSEGAYLRGEQ